MDLSNTDRKVVAVEMVSLDGVMEKPEEWAFSYANDEMNEVMMQTPCGHGKLELIKFHAPADDEGVRPSPANRPGIRHLAFLVDDLDDVLERLENRGFGTVGDVADYEDVFRLCYVSGPGGIIVELAEQRHGTTGSPPQA